MRSSVGEKGTDLRDKKSKWQSPGNYTPCNIGGQALLEGVMMRGKTSTALCCRDEKGELVLATERTPERKRWYHKVPVVRGVTAFLFSLVGGVKYIGKSAEIYAGDAEDAQLGKGGMILAVVLAVVLAVGMFVVLPAVLNYLVLDLAFDAANRLDANIYVLIMCLFKGVIKVAILIFYLWLTSRLKDIKRTYQYHGAEHRTINCYEHNLPLTVENVQSCSTRHARCGTTFMFYTVMISVLVVTLVTWVLSVLGLSSDYVYSLVGEGAGKVLYNVICMGVGLVCLPVIAGVSYEFLRLIAKAPDNNFFLIFKAPGFALQALTTKIPEDGMAEAAITAFNAVLAMDADPSIPTVDFYETTMKDARGYISAQYAAAGIDDPSEPDWLLCAVLGVSRPGLGRVVKLDKAQTAKMKKAVAARVCGKPLDYVLGESDFLGYKIKVDERVHLPRMETETTALTAVELIEKKGYRTALDLMTGSGCIARALAEKTTAAVTASDISDDALAVARTNLPERVNLIKSDAFANIPDQYDIIVSNPPYIKSGYIEGLQKEVTCQPRISLDGGADGLDIYRMIAKDAPAHLTNGGALVLEIGHDQAAEVCALLADGFTEVTVIKDLSGSDRVIKAIKR